MKYTNPMCTIIMIPRKVQLLKNCIYLFNNPVLENSENHHFGLCFWLSQNASHFELFPEKLTLPIKSKLLLTSTDYSLED